MRRPFAKLLLAPAMVGALFAVGPTPAAAATPALNCPANTFCMWATPNPTTAPDFTWTPGTGKVPLNDTVYKHSAAWTNTANATVCIHGNSPNSGAFRRYVRPGSTVNDATGSDDYYGTHVGPTDPSTGWCVD
jgi:hypothetical protein